MPAVLTSSFELSWVFTEKFLLPSSLPILLSIAKVAFNVQAEGHGHGSSA